MERKRRFQTRQQYAEEKAKSSKFDRLNKNLNILIAIVAIAIVVTLAIILSNDSVPKDQAEPKEKNEHVVSKEQQSNEDQTSGDQTNAGSTDVNDEDDENVTEETTDVVENTILPSVDPIVDEVQVNSAWAAYPTEQTGEHVSTFESGHIDYEEKLKAVFSVLDLQQENSIVLRVKNNGSANTAIAVVTSMDKTEMYRVSIEWIDGEGWKPTRLEVLNSVVGAY
ncbi:YrrS family protein [Solibacillus sp. MA9]|uniref:YrrS family protein n=1 Tax=Solibacillus palustris TaxID=2908203 RepID=A0ABS9UCX4_9BACL|nr:YrrS family protein [Solibacillus sp. MA9]MCH7322190.1 YrrS family protein [Solibacillus sp. MA9]